MLVPWRVNFAMHVPFCQGSDFEHHPQGGCEMMVFNTYLCEFLSLKEDFYPTNPIRC